MGQRDGFGYVDLGLVIGAGFGLIIGLALGDLVVGLVVGPLLGFAIGLARSITAPRRKRRTVTHKAGYAATRKSGSHI